MRLLPFGELCAVILALCYTDAAKSNGQCGSYGTISLYIGMEVPPLQGKQSLFLNYYVVIHKCIHVV